MGTEMIASAAGQLPDDSAWFRAVNAFSRATGWLHAPVTAYAKFGVVLFALLLLWGWWSARGTGDLSKVAAALWAPVGTLVAVGLNQPIVNGVHEARPYTALPHVLVLVSRSTDSSFPSDHATMAGAVTAGLFLVSRRLGLVSLVAALAMAFSRSTWALTIPVTSSRGWRSERPRHSWASRCSGGYWCGWWGRWCVRRCVRC